jgi:glycosyltransferase involved in cell wall biosynthesis
MKKLSILICSLVGREVSLKKLLNLLEPQKTDDIEIIVDIDNKEVTTGAKRNRLLKKATGEYIAFIDDDDLVSNDYIFKILNAIESKPDCCGMEGLITFKKQNITRTFIHSIKYNSWFTKDEVYYRCPNHLSPVKRILALKAMFPDLTISEDIEYSKRLLPFLKTEVYIKNPIYFYLTA